MNIYLSGVFKALLLIKKMMKIGGLFVVATALTACGGGGTSSGPVIVEPVPPAFDEPASGDESFSMLKADGTLWMNQQNEKVSLRGINLGNWLMMEMWMFGSNDVFGEGIPDQCSFEDALVDRFGESEKDRIMKVHRDSWITERDWDVMEDAGFNVVRIPFPYDLIENDDNPMTLKSDAWDYLDWAIAEAKEREMYVILDLHGAAGRQGWEHHSGCEGLNQLWDSETFRARTVWLWEEIAQKYEGEAAVAGYGLLNEPWGTDPATLTEFVVELYDAVRRYDDEHIVILPGHDAAGIRGYGDPFDLGMENVAFEMHFYPGIFGWGEIGYEVHRDWLTCGPNGDEGVCSWAQQLRDVYSPILIGEMQPWTSLGELGGEVTRATFDRYNELNWAATAWSLKTVSGTGGLGAGPWGMMTNPGDQLLVKGTTWACNDWETTFGDACDVAARSTIPNLGTATQTMYLVVKTGSFSGTDILYDEIMLTNDATGENIVLNSGFGDGSNWQMVSLWNNLPIFDFNYAAGEFAGSDTGAALRITAPEGGQNVALYQAIEVDAAASYTISGKFKDLGSTANEMWAEIYLVPEEPQAGVDVTGTVLNPFNVHDASIEEIEAFFTQFADMDYVLNHWVVDALTRDAPAEVFTNLPLPPGDLSINVTDAEIFLSWQSSEGDIEGYRVFRSTSSHSGFEAIADLDPSITALSDAFGENALNPATTYYYYVVTFSNTDESYPSQVVASGATFHAIPGQIEAENYTASHPGVKTETTGDVLGGGFNIGHFETGRWVEYDVDVASAGTYSAEFRLASLVGDVRFEVRVNGTVLGTVTVPNTGGWQDYETVTINVDLPAGESSLQLYSLDNQWNLNWMRFTLGTSNPDPEPEPEPEPVTPRMESMASISDAFGGATIDEGGVYTFPSSAEAWAGFANTNTDMYPLSFTEPGSIRFTGSVPSGGDAEVRFRFEFNPHPDVDPAYDTGTVTVSGAAETTYEISVPVQGDNTFSSVIMYLVTQDEPVVINDVIISSDPASDPGPDPNSDLQPLETGSGNSDVIVANPTTGTGGSNATVSIVNDPELSKDVIQLDVLNSDNVDQGYASIVFGASDISMFSTLRFQLLDTQGYNTVYITLVDGSGATWSGWTSGQSQLNVWTTISFDYSSASIDLTDVVEVRFAEWNSGTYFVSDLTFLAVRDGSADFSFPNPETASGGTNASVTIVNDAELSKDVVSLEVLNSDNVDEGYASIAFDSMDFSLFSGLEVQVFDTQGNNTLYITLEDGTGATWSGWTSDQSEMNAWTTIGFDYDGATIDLTAVVAVRIAGWNSGTYLISDLTLLAMEDTGTPGLTFPNPTSGVGGTNATVTIVNDEELAKDVISLEVLANDNVDQAYASIGFAETDFASYGLLEFMIKDTQGSNTHFITLVDETGATWSGWTSASSIQDTWSTIIFDYSSASSSIDLGNVVEIRVAEWNAGTYFLSDFLIKTN